MALDEGCPGFLGRMAVTATTPVAAYKAGYQFIGNIPRSLKIPEIGWVFDLVGIRDFVPLMTPQEKEQVRFVLFKFFAGHESFYWGHLYPYFGLPVMFTRAFKVRVDPLTCMLCHLQHY